MTTDVLGMRHHHSAALAVLPAVFGVAGSDDQLQVSLDWCDVPRPHRDGMPVDDLARVDLQLSDGLSVAALRPTDARRLARVLLDAADTAEAVAPSD